MLNKIPNELQAIVVSKLDPKSKAKLRSVSKEMKRAVDDTVPPTGSYRNKTGRFQSFWTKKRREQCSWTKIGVVTAGTTMHPEGYVTVDCDMCEIVTEECIKHYKKNRLVEILRIMRTETPEEFAHFFVTYYDLDPYTDMAWDRMIRDLRHQKQYLRRVTRLIKQWGKTDTRYAETYHIIMRRKGLYTPYEERMHADRIMDALLVQYIAGLAALDVTKAAYTSKGRERTLSEKVKYVTGLCRARTRDDAKQKNVKTPAKQSKQKKKN